ncbi:MAG: LPS export ABC transporter periplasmic protein LptC [candidate division WOR-3 bacterium]|nr:LPS export ABC transporter periplasmic protein LptC [candidate division WOR-3 bacterium]
MLIPKKRLLAKLFSGFVFLMFIFSFGFFIINFNSCKPKSHTGQSEPLPSQIVTNFTLFESSSGQKLYRLFADKAYVYEETNISSQKIVVNNPHILFYDEDGSIYSTLDAKKGVVYTQTSDLVAQDSVVVQTTDGTILHTDSLVWNNRERIITTDAWVKIENKQGVIEGKGLISDAALKRIEIKSSVTGKSTYEF